MKKIINGKVYNTETAKCLGQWDNGKYGNFEYCEEALYQTKKGTYFLYGEGGALSKYSEPCGNNGFSGGSGVEVLTREEAMAWAEQYLTADEYITIFGEIEEG